MYDKFFLPDKLTTLGFLVVITLSSVGKHTETYLGTKGSTRTLISRRTGRVLLGHIFLATLPRPGARTRVRSTGDDQGGCTKTGGTGEKGSDWSRGRTLAFLVTETQGDVLHSRTSFCSPRLSGR